MTKARDTLFKGQRCSKFRLLRLAAVFFATAALAACLAGCVRAGSSDGPDDPNGLRPADESEPSTSTVGSGTAACYADVSFEEFCVESDLIATGSYVGKSDSFMIEPVNGATPMFFTDYYFEVDQVCKGNLPESVKSASSQVITVRQRGGKGQLTETTNGNAVQPVQGQEYLLFLYRIENGADYNTEGDHFYLVSGSLGAWQLNIDDCYDKESGETCSVAKSELAARVSEAVAAGAAAGSSDAGSKAAYLADIEKRYRNGEIPEEYYDEVMQNAQKEDSQFARIMTDEEVAEYERNNPYSMGFS